MSKILFSVLCVILSLVALFTFVRFAFGSMSPLTARELVEGIADLGVDFSRTKENLVDLKASFAMLDVPEWEDISYLDYKDQDYLRAQNPNTFTVYKSECTVDGNGILTVSNGAQYKPDEYSDKGDYFLVRLNWFSRYTVFDKLIYGLKDLITDALDDSYDLRAKMLSGLLNFVSYISSVLDYFLALFSFVFDLFLAIITLAKDTFFFVIDCLLFLLKMFGIDAAGKLPVA